MTRVEQLTKDVSLYLGDCGEIIPTLGKVGVVVTSPPYNLGAAPWAHLGHWRPGTAGGSGGRGKWKNGASAAGVEYSQHTDALPWPEYVAWQHAILSLLWDRLESDGAIFYNHKPRVVGSRLWTPLELIPAHVILRQIVNWARPGGMNYSPVAFVPTHEWIMLLAKEAFRLKSRGVSGLGDVWSMSPEKNSHPAPFPVELPHKAIESSGDGRIVLDPFMGSGTTGVAAVKLGAPFIGIEKDESYFEDSLRRISNALLQPSLFPSPNSKHEESGT